MKKCPTDDLLSKAKQIDGTEENKSQKIRRIESELAKIRRERDAWKKQEQDLEHVIGIMQQRIERQSRKMFKLPRGQSPAVKGGHWHRVIIPDTHGSLIHKAAAGAFLRDLEYLRPREVVLLGDHLECGGFLAEHHTWGYIAQSEYTFVDDEHAANGFLDSVQAACPQVVEGDWHYIEGNHERRIETWCITKALRSGRDAQWLLSRLGTEATLSLPRRGIKYYRQAEMYCGLPVRGTIKLGHCLFTHGSSTADDAPAKMLAKFATNLIFGHIHRIRSLTKHFVGTGDLTAHSDGCLSEKVPLWRHTDPTTWSHGYGVQVVRPDGCFLHITVPILEGKSLLGPLLGAVK
jgi:hypothetical protein